MGHLKDEIKDLIEAGVIDWETGDKITSYYQQKPKNYNRLLLAFGILAAILIGLGIILIFAHNWDNLSQNGKTCLAFLPLISALGLVGYTLHAKNNSRVWKEVSALLLYFSIAAAIALVGQIYHIDGDERVFIRSWLLLGLPIIYLLSSSMVSMAILVGLLGLSSATGMRWHTSIAPLVPYDQLIIFLLILPNYLYLCLHQPRNNFTLMHHWVITLAFCALMVPKLLMHRTLGLLPFLFIFALLLGIGKSSYFRDHKLRWNPFLLVGIVGTCITLYTATFSSFWQGTLIHSNFNIKYDYILIAIFLVALYFFYKVIKSEPFKNLNPVHYSFLLFAPIYLLSIRSNMAALILSNILLSAIGLHYIFYGHRIKRLAILNFGMIILSAIILTRFFETDLSFVARGLCFVLIGLAFFGVNYFLVKKSSDT